MSFRTVSVVGLGYIGLPTAALLASRGLTVVGVDIDPTIVETINRGDIHIVEPQLDAVVLHAVSAGRLTATTEPVPADAFLITVPTPLTADKKADLSYVLGAASSIAPVLRRGNLVILESTSPVGATEAMTAQLASLRPDLSFPERGGTESTDIHVAYCPERVLPGKVIEELVSNDRAIGGLTAACAAHASKLYRLFVEGELVLTDVRSAELCKLAENAFRDVNIAFANELANVCEGLDMNVWEVIRLANRHPRVNILKPGPGVGGHCIAVDPWFIAEAAPKATPLIQAARAVNDDRPVRVVLKVEAVVAEWRSRHSGRPTIACLGLAFKPDIDDLRESPAVEVVERLVDADIGNLLIVEPHIQTLPAKLQLHNLNLYNVDAAINDADIVLLLVDHSVFRDSMSLALRKSWIDTRGFWSLPKASLASSPTPSPLAAKASA